MTDRPDTQLSEAVERVRAGAEYARPRVAVDVADLRTVLAELDRLTKALRVMEVQRDKALIGGLVQGAIALRSSPTFTEADASEVHGAARRSEQDGDNLTAAVLYAVADRISRSLAPQEKTE